MLSSPVQSGFEMSPARRLAADDNRPPADCVANFFGRVSAWPDDGDARLPAHCCLPAGDALEPPQPRYHWEHIPPRLAPAAEERDLLDLTADGDDAPSSDWESAAAEPRWWEPPAPAADTGRLSVSISAAPAAAEPERRPLHHSGGRLAGSGPQIAIGLPPAAAPASIQLQISGCPASLTVSVRTHHEPAAPRPARRTRPEACAESAARPAEDESRALTRALGLLRESGWYYGAFSWQEAQLRLQSAAEGTFLARDSLHRRFVFALSFQTARGPTSIRVQLSRGRFRLDAPAELLDAMPTFADVHALVEHYARRGSLPVDGWPALSMRLGRPLRREVPSLQHCCRLALNAAGLRPPHGSLPAQLEHYLDQYPYGR